MKKLLFLGCIAFFWLVLLVVVFVPGSMSASVGALSSLKQSPVSVPTVDPYCHIYIRYVVRHLHISEETLLRAKMAAKKDVLALLVKEGKVTRAQERRAVVILAQRLKTNPCS